MAEKQKKTKKKNRNRNNSLTRRIVSLTVFLDVLFLVLVLSLSIFLYLYSSNQTRDAKAEYQNEIVLGTLDDIITNIQLDAANLTEDQIVIDYLNYINLGNDPLIESTNPNYYLYTDFIQLTSSIVDYQSESLYDLVFLASETSSGAGTDGCFITHDSQVSSDTWSLNLRPWFTDLGESEYIMTTPYEDAVTGNYTITFVQKVFDGTSLIGYIGIDTHLETIASLLDVVLDEKVPEANEVIIFSNDGGEREVVYLSNESESDYYMQTSDQFASIDEANNYGEIGINYINNSFDTNTQLVSEFLNGDEYLMISNEVIEASIAVVTLYHIEQLNLLTMFGIVMGFAVIMIIMIALITNRQVRKSLSPVHQILKSIEQIKNGDYDVYVKVDGHNELRDIGDAINTMSREINKQVKLTYESLAYDVLTGLRSRAASREDLNETTFKSEDRSAVCLIQVDNLKNINITKGQILGDNLIKAIADELKKVFRTEDTLFSNGGNEFIFIKEKIRSLEEVEYQLNRLLTHFKEPLVVKNIRAEVKFHIGVSIYPTDGSTLEELIKKCDTALFKAAEAANKKIIFYNERIARSVSYQAEISEQLAQAIRKSQIYLKYQPLVSNKHEIYGFEALARWTSPTLGEIGPQVFIANAEESYLIIPIGTWILKEACAAQVRIREEVGIDYVISVNVSPVQILQRDFVEIVKKIIRETDINPEYLTLEITESLFMEATVFLEDTIDQLHAIGCKLSLDDFGTGYASLTYLREINFDNLKIDKSFVDGIFANMKDHRIIGTIVNLVHNLDMKVIAEGVETRKQFEYLKEIQTDVFQGYIFSKPLKIEPVIEYVKEFNEVPVHKRPEVYSKKNTK